MQTTTNRQPVPLQARDLRAAAIHIAQGKLLLRRAIAETHVDHQARTLHDCAGVLQHVLATIADAADGAR